MRTTIIFLPINTVSRSNVRMNRFVLAKRTKSEREAAMLITRDGVSSCGLPTGKQIRGISMVRYGVRLLDTGNLPGSMKAVQDGVCDALGIDDGPWQRTGIRWSYDQKRVKRENAGVEVTIESEEPT